MKFWNWVRNETSEERTLYLDGPIAEETWLGDEITPAEFRKDLEAGSDPITVWINSPGGDVFAAAQIYNMLMEYTGAVTVKIDGIAASAASVIAMAGGEVHMSPVSMMMIHNPSTIAWGDSAEMRRARNMLDEIKESLINAYELKTGLTRLRLNRMMTAETWMNAHTAADLGFADKIMFVPEDKLDETPTDETPTRPDFIWNRGRVNTDGMMFSRAAVTASLLGKMPKPKEPEPQESPPQPTGTPIESLYERLFSISH